MASATIHWTADNWETTHDMPTVDSGVGIHYADLPTENLEHDQKIIYTFYWQDAEIWENKNYTLTIEKTHAAPLREKIQIRKLAERDKIKVFLPS